ncbi:LytR C-terminal domain-containing protein [bacterium]|nr:LytR C-terminal domain-containing protein [bacterium]
MNIRFILLFIFVLICGLSVWYGMTDDPKLSLPDLQFSKDQAIVENDVVFEDKPIHVAILNGTSITGLASDVSLAIEHYGCVVDAIENAPHSNFKESILINRRLDSEAARQLANQLGGIRLIHEFDGRTVEDVVLVLGADYKLVTDSIDIISGRTGL